MPDVDGVYLYCQIPFTGGSMSESMTMKMHDVCESLFLHDLMRLSTHFTNTIDWARFGILLAQFQDQFAGISQALYEFLEQEEKEEFLKWFLLKWGEINILPQSEIDEYDRKYASYDHYRWGKRKINGIETIVVDLQEQYGFDFALDRDYKTVADGAWLLCDFLHDQYSFKKTHVREKDVIIDAGAYLGESALFFAHQLRGQCTVHSFEISPPNYQTLLDNLAINGLKNIHPNRLALSDKSGEQFVFTHDRGKSSVDRKVGGTSDMCTVETVTLDDYVARHTLERVDFIKMDIEGAEMATLRGAVQTIKQFKPRLAISIYHLPEDTVSIPRIIKELVPEYHFHFNWYAKRKGSDAILYASIDEQPKEMKMKRVPVFDHKLFNEVIYRSLFEMDDLKAQLKEKHEKKCQELEQRIETIHNSKVYGLVRWYWRTISAAKKLFKKNS